MNIVTPPTFSMIINFGAIEEFKNDPFWASSTRFLCKYKH